MEEERAGKGGAIAGGGDGMNGKDIVKLLELAPKNVRDEIGLTSRNRTKFAADFDARPSVEIMALALFYACRAIANMTKAAPIIANLKIDAHAIHYLIALVSAEEFSGTSSILGEIGKAAASKRATNAVKVRHQRKGGRTQEVAEGKAKIVAAWKTGKFQTKQRCAEEEYEAAGISYGTAIKALRNQ